MNNNPNDQAEFPAKRAAGNGGAGHGKLTTCLDALPFNREARVVSIEGSGPVAKRLMEMGIVPGAPVSVIRAAPLGDPIEIRIRGYHLALRRGEARTIRVTSDE